MHISMMDFGSHSYYNDLCYRVDAKPKQGELLNKVLANYYYWMYIQVKLSELNWQKLEESKDKYS